MASSSEIAKRRETAIATIVQHSAQLGSPINLVEGMPKDTLLSEAVKLERIAAWLVTYTGDLQAQNSAPAEISAANETPSAGIALDPELEAELEGVEPVAVDITPAKQGNQSNRSKR
jgi:hypothetical protein